jgi:hypothetical protein
MDIHIGTLIQERARILRIGPTELGIMIDTSKQNIYGIFKRQSIDTQLLFRISQALKHDFFQYHSKMLHLEGIEPSRHNGENGAESFSERLEDLARENAYLRRLNGLLEEKVHAQPLQSEGVRHED